MSINLGTIGKLNVVIGGDNSELDKALQKATSSVGSFVESSRGAVNAIGAIAIAATAAGVALVAGIVTKTMSAIDAQSKLARQLRGSILGLETLQRAASLAGIEKEKMTAATKRLDVAIGEALGGEKMYAEAFDRIGISAAELSKMDIDERILAVNEALDANVPASERAAAAGALLGNRMGAAIAEIDAATMRTAREEVEALGLAVSDVDGRTIERAGDAISAISEVARGAANRLTVALAPAIEAVAMMLRGSAIESRGFEDQITEAIDTALWLSGKLADAFRGVQVVFKGIVLGIAAIWDMANQAADGISRAMISFANLFTENKIDPDTTPLALMAASARQRVVDLKGELHDLATAPLPSETFKAFLEEAKAASDGASKAVIEAREKIGGGAGGKKEKEDKDAISRLEALRAALRSAEEAEIHSNRKRLAELQEFLEKRMISQSEYNQLLAAEEERHQLALVQLKRSEEAEDLRKQERQMAAVEALRNSLLTQEEIQIEAYERKLKALIAAEETELLALGEFQRLKEALEKQHADKMLEIRKKGWTDLEKFQNKSLTDQVKTVTGAMTQMTAGVARDNKAMFNANKAFGIADAIVNAYIGISKTMSAYPYPLNLAMAAGHAMVAFQQVRSIASQSFNGGGSGAAPSLAGGTAAPPVTPVGGGTAGGGMGGSLDQTIMVQGLNDNELFSGGRMRGLLENLLEAQRNGAKVVLAS